MNKRYLRRLPVAEASCDDVGLVKRIGQLEWIMKAKRERTEEGEYLVVSFLHRDDLLAGKLTPRVRTFFGKDDYITESFENVKDRWRTGSRQHVAYTSFRSSCASASGEDEAVISEWFGKGEQTALQEIDAFQEKVMQKRLDARHQKTKEKIDSVMKCVTGLPDGFREWIDQEFMWESRYFFYQYEKRHELEGTCSQCNKKSMVRRSLLRHGQKICCPKCQKELTAMAIGRMPHFRLDDGVTVILQKAGERLALRFFYVRKQYTRENTVKCDIHMEEYIRLFYGNGSWERYEWTYANYCGGKGWVRDRYKFNSNKVVLCPVNLKPALETTPFVYCGAEAFASDKAENPVDVPWYLETYLEHPEMEKLAKCGFHELIREFWKFPYAYKISDYLDGGKNRLHEVFRLPGKAFCSLLPKEITCKELRFVQKYCGVSKLPRPETVKKCVQLHLTEEKLLGYVKYAPFERMLAYICRQTLGNALELRGFVGSWLDYLEWCEGLEYDLQDSYYLFPKDFKREHDRVYQEYQKNKSEIEKRKQKKMQRKANERLKRVRKQLGDISDGRLQIVVPRKTEDIVEEGKKLHHCVAGYIPKVADESTLILFLRRKETADQPFRTLEWKKGEFAQCQGYCNNEKNDKEILDFLSFAKRKMLERMPEENAA